MDGFDNGDEFADGTGPFDDDDYLTSGFNENAVPQGVEFTNNATWPIHVVGPEVLGIDAQHYAVVDGQDAEIPPSLTHEISVIFSPASTSLKDDAMLRVYFEMGAQIHSRDIPLSGEGILGA